MVDRLADRLPKPWLRPQSVIQAVEDWTGITEEEIVGASREKRTVRARMLAGACLLSEEGCNMTAYAVAKFLNKAYQGTVNRWHKPPAAEVYCVLKRARELQDVRP